MMDDDEKETLVPDNRCSPVKSRAARNEGFLCGAICQGTAIGENAHQSKSAYRKPYLATKGVRHLPRKP